MLRGMSAPAVRLNVLGGFELSGPAGGGWSGPGKPLDVELAFLLALDRRAPMNARDMAGALWPGMSERWADERLPDLRHRLRRRCGTDPLTRVRGGFLLDEQQVRCDLWDLEDDPSVELLFGDLATPEVPCPRYVDCLERVADLRIRFLQTIHGEPVSR